MDVVAGPIRTSEGEEEMFRARFGMLGLLVLSVFAVLAPSASATIKFEWKVGGLPLGAGASREFTTTADGRVFDLSLSLGGTNILLLSSEIEVEKGAKIIGGKPGTEEETVIFKGVTVARPAKCSVESEGSPNGTVKTVKLKTQIVESSVTHEPLLLFQPETGTVFTNLLLLNKGAEECVLKGFLANLTGNLLGEPLPALTETLNGHLVFPEPALRKYVLSSGTAEEAGLLAGGNAVTLTGLTLVILTTDEKYGAF